MRQIFPRPVALHDPFVAVQIRGLRKKVLELEQENAQLKRDARMLPTGPKSQILSLQKRVLELERKDALLERMV